MRWLPNTPNSAMLIRLYGLARRRFSANVDDPAQLTDGRLKSAAKELNAIADDLSGNEQKETPH